MGLFVFHSQPNLFHHQDLIADTASGCRVTSTDGRTLLDFAAGIGVVSTGHAHPAVTAAVAHQAARQVNAQQNLFAGSVPLARLLDRLLPLLPPSMRDDGRLFFANSGSEAVDQAVKIARAHTGRPYIISFDNAFHGRTIGAMALTNSKTSYRQGFAPLMPSVVTARYPACLHCATRAAAPDGRDWYKLAPNVPPVGDAYAARMCCGDPQESLKWLLKQTVAPSEVAAIIVEPILGEGGFLTPPPGFLDGLRRTCDEIGALLILDEVQSGVARSGTFWAHSQLMDGEPDAIVFAKGIASGYPFAGVATRADTHSGLALGTLGGTYGGNPLGCAAAAATLDVIRDERLVDNAAARGAQLASALVKLAERYPIIDVRGRGLMAATEFGGAGVRPGAATAVVGAAMEEGLMLMTAGARETVRFLPPLVVSEAEVEEGVGKFEKALGKVFG